MWDTYLARLLTLSYNLKGRLKSDIASSETRLHYKLFLSIKTKKSLPLFSENNPFLPLLQNNKKRKKNANYFPFLISATSHTLRSSRQKRQFLAFSIPTIVTVNPCVTNRGLLGQCLRFKQCYPYLKLPDFIWEPVIYDSFDSCSYIAPDGTQVGISRAFLRTFFYRALKLLYDC